MFERKDKSLVHVCMYVCMYIEYFTDLLIYLLKHYSSIKYIKKSNKAFKNQKGNFV